LKQIVDRSAESDDYHSATATAVQEAAKLIEAEFDYVCTYTDIMLFRKRKLTTILKSTPTIGKVFSQVVI
jgi:hypothetical protein